MIPVTIDDRERAGGLIEALARVLGHAPLVARLPLGDVLVGEAWVIERKHAADFVASVMDGRLENQVRRLASEAGSGRAMLIVEGAFDADALRGFSLHEVRAAMLTIQCDWRLPLLRSRDVAETAEWVAALARRGALPPSCELTFDSPPTRGVAPRPAGGRPPRRGVDAMQLAVLKRVDGLGEARARRLLEHFGSIHQIRQASPEQLAGACGIGPELAARVAKFIK